MESCAKGHKEQRNPLGEVHHWVEGQVFTRDQVASWDVNELHAIEIKRGHNFKATSLARTLASVARSFEGVLWPQHSPCLADAPWCNQSRGLLPVLEELGMNYQNHSTVTIAMIDVTANDIQLVHLDRHPFFRLFPANSQQVRAPGSRTWNRHIILMVQFLLFQPCLLPSQPHAQL